MRALFAFMSILAVPFSLMASADVNAKAPSLFFMTLQMLAALVLVIGLFLLLYAFARKSRTWLPGAAKGQLIDVRTVRHLGPKKALYLVDIDGRRFFLSAAGDQVRLLSEWSTDTLQPQPDSKTNADFASLMRRQIDAEDTPCSSVDAEYTAKPSATSTKEM